MMNLLMMQFPPVSCYHIAENLPDSLNLRQPYSMHFFKRE